VLFAFEEAIGFMMGTEVLDKDGVSAGVLMAEMALHLHQEGKTLLDQLQQIYTTYGYHVSCDSYYLCHDPPTIKKIFERIRSLEGPGSYPSSIPNPCEQHPQPLRRRVQHQRRARPHHRLRLLRP